MANQTKPIEFKIWYRPQYLHSVCHVCKKAADSNSVVCPSCQLVTYCGQGHLEGDLYDHEELCEALKEAGNALRTDRPFDKAYLLGAEESRNFRLGIVGLCSKFLRRPLAPWEIEVCLFPPMCASCSKLDPTLQTCPKCSHTKWCSIEHKPKNHDLYCSDLTLFKEILLRKLHIVHPPLIDKKISNIHELPGSQDDCVYFSLVTEIATSPLTILHAVPECENAVVHIIGPEPHFEANNLAKWDKFLFELMPRTNSLHLAFVGPEIGPLPERTVDRNERRLKLTFHQLLYHEYKGEAPNLVCALNPGLYRSTGYDGKDTWSETIKAMFSYPEVPVLITAYTEKEVKWDFKRVKQSIKCLKTVVEPSKNPFSSLRPLMNFVSDEATPVVFKNSFYTVLKRPNPHIGD